MASLKNVIYLSNDDYQILSREGSLNIDGVTLTYSEDDIYVVEDDYETFAGLIMPNWQSRSLLTNGSEWKYNKHGWVFFSARSSSNGHNASSKTTFNIGGYTYVFYEGYQGTDWNHASSIMLPIPKDTPIYVDNEASLSGTQQVCWHFDCLY